MADGITQAAYWNGEVGQRWARNQAVLDAVFSPLTDALFEAAGLRAGTSVLDIGCGAGETTLRAAAAVGPEGAVAGADVSAPLLAAARERPMPAGAAPVAWVEADVETYPFPPASLDAALSRFGTMFFADTQAAFANIRAALKPGGQLTLLCWQAMAANPWVSVPRAAILPLVPAPGPPPPPDQPGPFRFADGAALEARLRAAGFRDIVRTGLRVPVTLGRDPETAARVACELGPPSHLLREAEPELRARALASVAEALRPHATDGGVQLEAACWLVAAG
ncbi:class I SAM-dependent methyltransferase [Methylobacterium radiodurans]|uniref:Methyltransferase type 11 n=1 Tax=Methylobacterium radiodurans TaxID=2202828 RepID=A0A2U8VLW2_9HYPH|nr:methyltransferase domain-containing protein [Methylobacterium radiodurans]AWN34540.1 methyltransferase type 11 [Methylobacterium radiodurans]